MKKKVEHIFLNYNYSLFIEQRRIIYTVTQCVCVQIRAIFFLIFFFFTSLRRAKCIIMAGLYRKFRIVCKADRGVASVERLINVLIARGKKSALPAYIFILLEITF